MDFSLGLLIAFLALLWPIFTFSRARIVERRLSSNRKVEIEIVTEVSDLLRDTIFKDSKSTCNLCRKSKVVKMCKFDNRKKILDYNNLILLCEKCIAKVSVRELSIDELFENKKSWVQICDQELSEEELKEEAKKLYKNAVSYSVHTDEKHIVQAIANLEKILKHLDPLNSDAYNLYIKLMNHYPNLKNDFSKVRDGDFIAYHLGFSFSANLFYLISVTIWVSLIISRIIFDAYEINSLESFFKISLNYSFILLPSIFRILAKRWFSYLIVYFWLFYYVLFHELGHILHYYFSHEVKDLAGKKIPLLYMLTLIEIDEMSFRKGISQAIAKNNKLNQIYFPSARVNIDKINRTWFFNSPSE